MKLSKLIHAIGYSLIVPVEVDKEVISGYTSDLLSDVMGNAVEESVFITIQAHKNTVAVAMQLDFPAIIICNNREVPADMAEAAKKADVAVLQTSDNQFTASYKVYRALFGVENEG